jgi:murein DD-endopeptidase MepM/ murein hydrolase activator NlpD
MEKLKVFYRWTCFFLIIMIMCSCSGLSFKDAGPKGVYHRVKKGETLSAIAAAYQVDLQGIAKINNIADPSLIKENSVLFIPHAQKVVEVIQISSKMDKASAKIVTQDTGIKKPETAGASPKGGFKRESVDTKRRNILSHDTIREQDIGPFGKSGKVLKADDNHLEKPASKDKQPSLEEPAAKSRMQDQMRSHKNLFIWPVMGKVVSFFGKQANGNFFKGIKIAPAGEAVVLAAGDGEVANSERLKYYGETVIIQHADDYATVYANLAVRAVDVKSRVKKGDRIGFIGNVPANEDLFLYFEIRHKNKAKNPLSFLP